MVHLSCDMCGESLTIEFTCIGAIPEARKKELHKNILSQGWVVLNDEYVCEDCYNKTLKN